MTAQRTLGRLDNAAQERTATLLAELCEEFPALHVFHNIQLPGGGLAVHHLLLHGGQLIMIGDKPWAPGGTYALADHHEGDEFRVAQYSCIVLRDGEPFPGNMLKARRYCMQMGMWLEGYARECVIAVHDADGVEGDPERYGFRFLPVEQLQTQLRELLVVSVPEPTGHASTLEMLRERAQATFEQAPPFEDTQTHAPKTAASFRVTPNLADGPAKPAMLQAIDAAAAESTRARPKLGERLRALFG